MFVANALGTTFIVDRYVSSFFVVAKRRPYKCRRNYILGMFLFLHYFVVCPPHVQMLMELHRLQSGGMGSNPIH